MTHTFTNMETKAEQDGIVTLILKNRFLSALCFLEAADAEIYGAIVENKFKAHEGASVLLYLGEWILPG